MVKRGRKARIRRIFLNGYDVLVIRIVIFKISSFKLQNARLLLIFTKYSAKQVDWLEGTDEEIDEQELEAHYSYMAKIQEVPTADSGTDTEPLEQVQYDVEYNVFATERQHSEQPEFINNTCVVDVTTLEKVDSNVIPISPDMCDNDIQTDQNAEECDDECVTLANLIANLKLDVNENKKIQNQLKKSNASLARELKECKSILEETSRTLGESNKREQYFEIQDLKAQLQDKNIAISELKKLIEKCKGKSVETNFDQTSIIRQPNAQRIPKPSVLGKSTIFSDSLERKSFSKTKSVPKTKCRGLSKPVTTQIFTSTTGKIVQLILFIIDSGCTKHMTGNLKLLCNFVEKYLGTVRFSNDQFAPILGYEDLVQGNIMINRVYYVEGLNHNLFLVGQFCDADLEHFINLIVSWHKASLTQAWLWLRRPKRSSFKTKVVPSSKRRLNLLHMDLCGPMRVECINGKKYILASDYDNSGPASQLQNVSPSADTTTPPQQELDLLFGRLHDGFFTAGTLSVNKSYSPTDNSKQQDTPPTTNIQSSTEPTTPTTNVNAEENNDNQAADTQIAVITEYLVNISKRRAFWSLNKDILKITILTTNMLYPSWKIWRIRACTHQRPQRKQVQYAISEKGNTFYSSYMGIKYHGRYQTWSLLQETPIRRIQPIGYTDILIRASQIKKVMADKGKKSSMETFVPNDKADYYSRITSITVNEKNAYKLKGKFLDDLHNNAFSETNGKDAVEHIEYYQNIIDPIKLPTVDHDKLRIVVFPILLAGGARRWFDKTKESIIYWVDLTAKFFGKYYPSSCIEGNNTPSEKEETVKFFKIETDIFDYETPLYLAFNEFNYLLKVDLDLLTKDIIGFKTYEDYKEDWIYEWNKYIPWVYDKPWLDNGIWKERKPVKHTCKPFNYKTRCSEWSTCSWREDGYCNGGNLPGAYVIGNSLHYQDLEWYEALEDSELKDKDLRNKSTMKGLISDDESSNDCWKRWKSHEIYYHNYDEREYKNETHEEG
ncbi:hypothetical protein Tco_0073538 [Tanacetum coccineum]